MCRRTPTRQHRPISPLHIRAITFDVGGTLIEPWPSVGHVYAAVAARHGFTGVAAETLNARFRATWAARAGVDHTRRGWEQFVDEVFLGLIPSAPSASFFPELYDHFGEAAAWRVFDDTRPALAALAARGVRLGVISNWDERLRGLLRRLELERYFQVIVVSCEAGSAKPARAIFDDAAEKFGLPPGAMLHVGDSGEMDVEGARAAGFAAVRILRSAKQNTVNEIASLTALEALLAAAPG